MLRTACVTYPGSTEHIRAVRVDLRVVLRGCPMASDVILCASELAANAALHSNSCRPGGTFTVRAIISPSQYARRGSPRTVETFVMRILFWPAVSLAL
jgi:hypothetical protein